MLPGVGIFGSDPISKILIQLLRHFEFEVHAIWTNHYEIESSSFLTADDYVDGIDSPTISITNTTSNTSNSSTCSMSSSSSSSTPTMEARTPTRPIKLPQLITTSIDTVLLNKNVDLVFVCCQPNLHSQIAIKALGIGKNVICVHPTCKGDHDDEIEHMITSAHYYPSLFASINYGGLKYLNEYRLIKQSMHLIGTIKLCNIVINCQNIALVRPSRSRSRSSSTMKHRQASLSSLIDSIALIASSSTSHSSLNWLADRELGAGVLNRFGAAMISLCLNLFEHDRVTKVYGCLRTFVEDANQPDLPDVDLNNNTNTNGQRPKLKCINLRKITADDHCTFQMNLEPSSVMVNVTINSLSQTKYSHEIVLCGESGALVWNNSKLLLRRPTASLSSPSSSSSILSSSRESNTSTNCSLTDSIESLDSFSTLTEIELNSTEPCDQAAESFLNTYRNVEKMHPELPLVFIRGLYYYLANIKKEFVKKSSSKNKNLNSNGANSCNSGSSLLENFEHMRIVQTIIRHIQMSSEKNRWVSVSYDKR